MIGTVLVLGGGGFSMSDDGSSAIDDHLLDLTGTSTTKVCFVPLEKAAAGGTILAGISAGMTRHPRPRPLL